MIQLRKIGVRKWKFTSGNHGTPPNHLDLNTTGNRLGVQVGDIAWDISIHPNPIWICYDNTPGHPVWERYSPSAASNASDVTFDNTTTIFTTDNVQTVLEEVSTHLQNMGGGEVDIAVSNIDIDDNQIELVDTFAKSSGEACLWDYVIKNNDNHSMRTGTLKACWNVLDQVEFYEDSTNDIGDTLKVILNVQINGTNIELTGEVQLGGGDNWSIKAWRKKIM